MAESEVVAAASAGVTRHFQTRRRLLGVVPLVTVAVALKAKPAGASVRTVECVADLEVN